MNARRLKLIAFAYALKTLLFGLVWLANPDLPQQATARARALWVKVAGSAPAEPR